MRSVSYNQGYEQFKNKHFNNFAEVSAKTNHNIMEIYTEFYKEIFSKNKDKVLEKRNQNKRIFETIKNEENNCKCCYQIIKKKINLVFEFENIENRINNFQ